MNPKRKPIQEIEPWRCPVDGSPMREQLDLNGATDLVCPLCGSIVYSDGTHYRRRAGKGNDDER